MKKVENKQLTVSGVNLKAYSTTNNGTVTTDGVYQSGNLGFLTLALQVTAGSLAVSYQISFDNVTWFTPYSTDGTNLTAIGNIAAAVTTNVWVVLQALLGHYVRFVFVSTGVSTFSANALWQDES